MEEKKSEQSTTSINIEQEEHKYERYGLPVLATITGAAFLIYNMTTGKYAVGTNLPDILLLTAGVIGGAGQYLGWCECPSDLNSRGFQSNERGPHDVEFGKDLELERAIELSLLAPNTRQYSQYNEEKKSDSPRLNNRDDVRETPREPIGWHGGEGDDKKYTFPPSR
jgi:hypothetical protein